MNTVWKTRVAIMDRQKVAVPAGARPVFVAIDPQGVPSIWWEVNSEVSLVDRHIWICGTGNPVPFGTADHIGSFVHGQFVWHVYVDDDA
jgi:hypothetical protein